MLRLTPELIEELDKHYPSPGLLAARVYNELQTKDLTNEDLQAFCVEYLASQAQTGELAYMMNEIKSVNKLFYIAHYDRICNRMKTPQDTGLSLVTEQEKSGSQSSTTKEG